MKNLYPYNYVCSIWTPKQIISGKNNLSWFQIVLTFVFLTALLLIPFSLTVQPQKQLQLETMMPELFSLIQKEDIETFKQIEIKDGQLRNVESSKLLEEDDGILGVLLSEEDKSTVSNVLNFDQTQILLKDVGGFEYRVNYTPSFSLRSINTNQEFIQLLQDQWYQQNQALFFLSFMLMISGLFLLNQLVLFIFGSLLIWFTRKSQFSPVKTFKEAVNLLLNTQGVGVLVALVCSLFTQDISVLLTVQSAGLVLMLVVTFLTMNFMKQTKEEYVLKEET